MYKSKSIKPQRKHKDDAESKKESMRQWLRETSSKKSVKKQTKKVHLESMNVAAVAVNQTQD